MTDHLDLACMYADCADDEMKDGNVSGAALLADIAQAHALIAIAERMPDPAPSTSGQKLEVVDLPHASPPE